MTKLKNYILIFLVLLLGTLFLIADLSAQDDSIYVQLADSKFWKEVQDLEYYDGNLFTLFNSGLSVYRRKSDLWQLDSLAFVPLTKRYEECHRLITEILCYSYDGSLAFVHVVPPGYPEVIAETQVDDEFEDLEYWRLSLYLACGYDGMKVYDMTDRTNPKLVSHLIEAAHAVAVERYRDYLYLVDDYNGLHIYDISEDPFHPRYLGEKLFYYPIRDIAVNGDQAFCAYSDSGTIKLDLTNPVSPVAKAVYKTDSYIDQVSTLGNYVFAADVYGSYQVYHNDSASQVTSLKNPGFYNLPLLIEDEDKLYLAAVDSSRVAKIFRIDPGWKLKQLTELSTAGSIEDVAFYSDYAFIASGAGPLLVIEPDRTTGGLNLLNRHPARANALSIASDYLVMADNYNRRLWITEIDSDSKLEDIGFIPIVDDALSISAELVDENNLAIVSLGNANMYLFQYNLQSGKVDKKSVFRKLNTPSAAEIHDHRLYYATHSGSGKVYDIGDISDPQEINQGDWGVGANTLVFDNQIIYAVGISGMRQFTIRDEFPLFTGQEYISSDTLTDLVFYKNYLVCAVANFGLLFLKNDNDSISFAGSFGTSGDTRNLAISDSLLLAADKYSLLSFNLSLSQLSKPSLQEIIPERFNLAQNYPNPFNLETVISLDIPESVDGKVLEVEIYNVLGRKVRSLMSEIVSAGKMNIRWDGNSDRGNNLSTGVYFLRARIGGIDDVIKMLLLK